jgi:hypothetical protein
MRNIKVSDEVWQAIAGHGKFGETEDDVLRRLLGLENSEARKSTRQGQIGRGSKRFAQIRMSARVQDGYLVVEFETGKRRQWNLPKFDDKEDIRRVRYEAVNWALDNGASNPGQKNHVLKALTDAGYYVSR